LQEGRFDFVIARVPPGYDSREFDITPARVEEVSFVVRRAHPLAEQAEVTLAEIAAYEWVIQERGSPIRQALEAAFLTAGLAAPQRITNSSSLIVALAILETSDAIAPQTREVVELLTRGDAGANLATLRLTEPIVVSPYFIIRVPSRPFHSATEQILMEVFRRI
jgi:DNA-binding transcriptional LysR family regulator